MPGLLWLWLFAHLRDEWTLNAQYNYGWAVPVMAVLFFWRRWKERPDPAPTGRGAPAVFLAAIGLFVLLLPLRVIETANPDWRLLSWTLALVVVSYSLLALWRGGGGIWVRYFAFPVCFPLVAVPWLAQIENVVVQGLTRAVAHVGVEAASWAGVGAYQLGNVIELPNGFVGVDEACSGVKTLQAAIMVTLVLGELLQLRKAKRVALLAVGCVWMFACNVLRATILVLIAARNGTDELHRWHDLIGTILLVGGMAGLLVIAWWLRGSATSTGNEMGDLEAVTIKPPIPDLVAVAWIVCVFAATELWYRSHERKLVALPAWEARWPRENGRLAKVPIAETTRAILRYDAATSAAWEDDGGVWWGFFSRWQPQRTALQLVNSHSPEICLPAAGRTFKRELPAVLVDTGMVRLVFRAFEFEQSRQPLFAYVCIQEDNVAPVSFTRARAGFDVRSRLLAAWHGERNLGQRLLELAVLGPRDANAASTALMRTVSEILATPGAKPRD